MFIDVFKHSAMTEWVCVGKVECQNFADKKQGQRRKKKKTTCYWKTKNGEIISQNEEGEYKCRL